MATIKENMNQLVKTNEELREVIGLCYAPVADNEGMASYPSKLARLAVDDPTLQTIGVGGRTTADGMEIKDSIAVVDKVYGETIRWNQLAENRSRTTTNNGIVYSIDENNKIHLKGTSTNVSSFSLVTDSELKKYIQDGDKILLYTTYKFDLSENNTQYYNNNFAYIVSESRFITAKDFHLVRFRIGQGVEVDETCVFVVFNLTTMFPKNEPDNIQDFCQRIFATDFENVTEDMWASVAAYSVPALVNSSPKSIVSKSRNLWDGTFSSEGRYISVDNSLSISSNFNVTNYIAVKENKKYVVYGCSGYNPSIVFYDKWKRYISGTKYNGKSEIVVESPQNAAFAMMAITVSVPFMFCEGDNTDIEYQSYFESTLDIDPKSIRDENGEQVFPEGLLSVGDVRDEIDWQRGVAVKRIGSVDLGSLTYRYNSENLVFYAINRNQKPYFGNLSKATPVVCPKYITHSVKIAWSDFLNLTDGICRKEESNHTYIAIKDTNYSTIDALQQSLIGVLCYFELVTPIEYPLPSSWSKSWMRVSNGGTERITADGMTLPLHADIAYRTANAAALANDLSNAQNLL